MNKCPQCHTRNEKVLIQNCMSYKKNYHLVCGNCRTEFDFLPIKGVSLSSQLGMQYSSILEYLCMEYKEKLGDKINKMTDEEIREMLGLKNKR